ncbi:hypothetical protein FACS1894176_05640 [Bacteroidia bacterium]|nr:hypothetical protein FACS189428_3420 [Clostridia bacterium]GHV25937.1 hypothetical protein FACS1894176_05640 [Bacteroidia bacterium]
MGIQLEKDADNKIIFKSYGQVLKLDLTGKTIGGLTQKGGEKISFKNLGETLRVANLINAIKHHALLMTEAPNTDHQVDHPFYIDKIGNVMFRGVGENTTVLNGAKGREALFGFGFTGKAGTTNEMDEISSIMNSRERKEDLARYLNRQTPPFWRKPTPTSE